jgi:RNA polymerase sigma factor (TIGR02999 family)
MGDPTQNRDALEQAVSNAPEDLLPLVYKELRQLAGHKLANERPGQTLEATALVHEAWLKLAHEEGRRYNNPKHFYCAAATAMRRILIDNARRKNAQKHGGDLCRTTLGDVAPAERMPTNDLVALDEALSQLAKEDPDAVQLVELRFFTGMRHQEAARLMGITRRQADGLWAYARAWLYDAVQTNLGAMHDSKSP